jgi:hypothetical protein
VDLVAAEDLVRQVPEAEEGSGEEGEEPRKVRSRG